MRLENRARPQWRGGAILAALLFVSSAARAAGPIATIETGNGEKVTLEGDGPIRCVYDGRLTCTRDDSASEDAGAAQLGSTLPPSSPANGITLVSGIVAVHNLALVPQVFTLTFNNIVPMPIGSSLLGGSVAGSVTDATFSGTGGVGTSGSDPLYVALVDGSPVAGTALHAAPFAVPGPGVPAAFAFAGQTLNVAAASFGLPGPSTSGPAVTTSVGIRLNFLLGAFNSAGFVSVLAASSGAAAMTLSAAGTSQVLGAADLGCVGDANGSTCTGASARSIGQGLRLDNWNVTVSGAGSVCPRSVRGETGITNLSPFAQRITLIFTLPVSPIGTATVIGGSFGGAVADTNFDGVGGLGTVAMSALYTALIDDAPVATLDADPFFVPGPAFPGTFAFAGASQAIPATSFGLPGPTTPGPPVAASIGILLDFNVGGLDSLAVTSDFIVDCVPTPTSTPSNTATTTVTLTPSNTPTHTPVPPGGSCTDTSQCASGLFCVDAVCCTSPCDDPLMRCNVPPNIGTCSSTAAPAPALSPTGLLVALVLLLAVAGLALWRGSARRAGLPGRD